MKSFETFNSYASTVDNLLINNGTRFVSIGIQPGRAHGTGVFTGLTPAQAREVAAALIEGAEDVEQHPYSEAGR